MKRLLAHSIMLAGLTASSQLLALGLGELTLYSSLNQPLKAEIELVDSKGLTEWDIKAAIAAQAEFDRAGVDRTFFLNNINFTVENGRIVVTSREPVNEPFLNFLIELNWPAGRVLREYTVLLDPPVFEEQSYDPLVSAPGSATEIEFVETSSRSPAYVNNWDSPASSGSYKVQQDDTLWEIALKTRPNRNISPQQMMLAIQQENPEAFIGGNINRLKSHYVLNIPDADRVDAISMGQAVAEVARQNQALKAGAAQVDATGRSGQVAPQRADNKGGEVRLLSANSETATSAGAGGEVAQGNGSGNRDALENDLAIALENADKSRRENEELRARLVALDEQINTLQRLISLKDDQLASLQVGDAEPLVAETVIDVEAPAQDFNYAEAPENTEVANAATSNSEPEANAPAELAPAAEDEELAARRARLAALLAEEQQKAQQAEFNFMDEMKANPILPAAGAGILLLVAFLILRAIKKRKDESIANEEGGEPAHFKIYNDPNSETGSLDDFDFDDEDDMQAPAAKTKSAKEPEVNQPVEHFDTVAQTEDALSESDIYIAYGKFDQAADLLKEAIASEPDRAALRLKLLEVYAEMDNAQAFAKAEGELEALKDADASKEARLLRQRLSSPIAPIMASTAGSALVANEIAKASEPEEDFASLNDDFGDLSDDFSEGMDFGDALDMSDTKAEELADDLAASPEDVPTLDDLGSDDGLDFGLDDDFTNKPESVIAEPSTIVLDDDDGLDFSLDDKAEVPVVAEEAKPALDLDDGLDFDLDFESETAPEPIKPEASSDESLSLDDDMALEFSIEPPAIEEKAINDLESLLDGGETASDDLPDLSFDMDETGFSTDSSADDLRALERELTDAVHSSTVEAAASDDEFSFDLGDETADDLAVETADIADDLAELADTVDEGDIDLDALAAADDEFDFLAGTDECATKLDLARAYIDMEDIEGARELLQEVVSEGSDQQKADARELMNNLA